jgi:hypothetical protein
MMQPCRAARIGMGMAAIVAARKIPYAADAGSDRLQIWQL